MAEPLTIRQAVRFLERVYAIAALEQKDGSLVNWISVKDSNPENRARRRGVCLSAIRAINDDPKHDVFSTYPGATEDLYFQAALDTFLPDVRSRARSDALATLINRELTIGRLRLSVQDPQIARRLNSNAVKVQHVGRLLDLPVTVKPELPELTLAEIKEIVGSSRASGTVLTRLRRTIYMREVRRSSDPLLLQLMAPPNGVSIVDAFAKSVGDGQRATGDTLDAFDEAVFGMQTSVSGDPDYIWKFPPALSTASVKLAQSVGRPDAALSLTKFSLAWAQHEKGAVQSALDVANNAIMALGLLGGPVGALAADILGVVLATIGAVVSLLDEMQQDQAAVATTFADDGDKLSKGGRTSVAALKGVASIAAAVVPLGLARIVARTARSGATVAREVETAVAGDTRAVTRPESGTTHLAASNRGLAAEPVPIPSASRVKAAASVVEGKAAGALESKAASSASGGVKATADAAPGSPLEKVRGTADHGVPPPEAKTGGPGSHATDLDAEFVDGPHRDPKSLSKAEVEQARRTVVEDFERLSKEKLRPLNYDEVALSPQQRETFGRLAGRLFTDEAERAAPRAANAARAALLRNAEAEAADLRRRLAAHWSQVLPRRGKQTAEDAAMELLQKIVKETPTGGEANRAIREKLFSTWRDRFLNSVARDTKLVEDLRTRAGVIFNRHAGRNGNAFGVPFRNPNGVTLVGLDVDHAVIGHSEAVIDALRTGDSRYLLSTVDAKNLQLLAERENRNFIETIRNDNRLNWGAPPQAPPAPSITP